MDILSAERYELEDLIMKWIRLKKYCELTGDTPRAVHARRHKGQWMEGCQSRIGPDGNLWINLLEVEKWVEADSQSVMKTCLKE